MTKVLKSIKIRSKIQKVEIIFLLQNRLKKKVPKRKNKNLPQLGVDFTVTLIKGKDTFYDDR